MRLPFFSRAFISILRDQAEANLPRYGGDPGWIDLAAIGKSHLHESNLVVDPPPSLLVSETENAVNDAENAKRIYTWLRSLTPALAMEERLWACLCHCIFQDYMKARWPADSVSSIHRRYLFEGRSFAALTRNGIARLWWAGHLTLDEQRRNPFELTETLFMRQDIQVSLLERSLGKCRNVRMAVLDFLRENESWLGSEAFGRRIQLLLKELNLLGGVAILDTLAKTELQEFLKRAGESLAKDVTLPDTAAS